MRILQIITSSQRRGAEIFAATLSAQLTGRGHQVWLASLYEPPVEEHDRLVTNGVRRVELGGRAAGRIEPRVLYRLARLIRRVRPDVIQANGFHALKYASLLKRAASARWPLVYRNISIAGRWIRRPWQRAWGRFLFRQVDRVLAVSDVGADDLCATYSYPRQRAVTARRGIELPTRTCRVSVRRAVTELIGCPQDVPLLFHLGRFSPEKNHVGLFSAFERIRRQHPAAQLVLCGDGPLRGEIESLILRSHLTGSAHVLGDRPDAPELLAGGDLLLLTSHVEGVPGVVLEAASHGVPAVCTDVGGVREAVHDGVTGRLAPAGDMRAVAAAACDLLTDPQRSRRMGREARALIEREYEITAAVDRFEREYLDLTAAVSTRQAVTSACRESAT